MAAKEKKDEPRKRVSKTTMMLGAAGLFLFIVGVKRSFRTDAPPAPDAAPEREGGAS
jgi:hypothetical protein